MTFSGHQFILEQAKKEHKNLTNKALSLRNTSILDTKNRSLTYCKFKKAEQKNYPYLLVFRKIHENTTSNTNFQIRWIETSLANWINSH